MKKIYGEQERLIPTPVRGGLTALAATLLLTGTVSHSSSVDELAAAHPPRVAPSRLAPLPVIFVEDVDDARFSGLGNRTGRQYGAVREGVKGTAFCLEGELGDDIEDRTARVRVESGPERGRTVGNVPIPSLAENLPPGHLGHDADAPDGEDFGVKLLPICP